MRLKIEFGLLFREDSLSPEVCRLKRCGWNLSIAAKSRKGITIHKGDKKMKATNIIWDVDYDEDVDLLPTEIEIPEGMENADEISDYLSDVTGYCHEGYVLEN